MVYLARQIKLNRRVAFKMLTGHYGKDELERFLDEAETAAGLQHNNIAHIYEVGEHEGAPFYSLEYVEAGSLADWLRKGSFEPQEAAQLLIQVARALHFAHQNGVVHRDMKPGNVLLDAEGTPKVADFGIAKRLKEDTHLTVSGAVIGTPTYMAPEQAKGSSRHVGPAADIYSLGAILYEMLAGRPPFLPEESETAVTVRVLTEDPVSPAWHRPEIPRDLEVICLKCLEKNPRDRYQSAAAFAEDLRRFLEDETIIARPPTTAVRTLKWVRRHPWKFVGVAATLLLLVAGLARLAEWELYQRPHLEYATEVDWVNGGLEPIAQISRKNASHCAAYLRLTRRGRRGPVIKAETLNSRAYPAVLRRIQHPEMIPFYMEGLAGAQPYSEKPPETTTLDFFFDGRDALEAISRDRNGTVNWRILYDHQTAGDHSSHTARARFLNVRGFDAVTRDGASHMEFERDAQGRDVKITFFNASGQPSANGEGVFGYQLTRDELGRIIHLVNLGRDGQPIANRAGQVAFAIKWGKQNRIEPRDGRDQPVSSNGIAAIVTELDHAGNPTAVSNLAADGKPVQNATTEWSVQEMKRNDAGELIERTYFKADPKGALRKISQFTVRYDQFGHPADLQFTGAASWRSALVYDAKGNLTEEKFLDAKGQPTVGERGYAITRYSYTPSSHGMRIEQTYFDPLEKKTYNVAGYHRLISEYNPTGLLYRQTMDEHDPTRFQYYRYVTDIEIDPQGRTRHTTSRFEDEAGRLVTTDSLVNNASEDSYDENGSLTTEWKMGCDPKEFGGPVLHVETEWHSTGAMKRWVRQVCDANRKPLAFISNGNAARYEEESNSIGQRERIFETGFDERVVGFSSREVKFAGGNFQSVTHKRTDGTVLESVRVMITAVNPEEGQPRAAELKPGDQFLTANGQPIISAYEWATTGNFQGGPIEVLRDGRQLRVDGFNAGPIGVVLQDRGPVPEK